MDIFYELLNVRLCSFEHFRRPGVGRTQFTDHPAHELVHIPGKVSEFECSIDEKRLGLLVGILVDVQPGADRLAATEKFGKALHGALGSRRRILDRFAGNLRG